MSHDEAIFELSTVLDAWCPVDNVGHARLNQSHAECYGSIRLSAYIAGPCNFRNRKRGQIGRGHLEEHMEMLYPFAR